MIDSCSRKEGGEDRRDVLLQSVSVSVGVYLDCCLRHGVPGGSPRGSEPGPPGARRWP